MGGFTDVWVAGATSTYFPVVPFFERNPFRTTWNSSLPGSCAFCRTAHSQSAVKLLKNGTAGADELTLAAAAGKVAQSYESFCAGVVCVCYVTERVACRIGIAQGHLHRH